MNQLASLRIRLRKTVRQFRRDDAVVLGIGILLALLVRLSLHAYYTRDFYLFTQCYQSIHKEGFAAFKSGCTDYSPLYEYFLYIETILFPGLSNTAGPKLPSIAFDFVGAWFAYLVVRLKYPSGVAPSFAALALLFAPTVVINSAGWGQFDMVYAALLLASVYFLLKEKSWLAMLAFGLAISVKFQAIVLAPLILILCLRRRIPWASLLMIPGVYFVTVIPAWIAGRSLASLLTIYAGQVNQYNELTVNAPSIYAWIPVEFSDQLYLTALLFGASACLLFVALAWKSRRPITAPVTLLLALLSVLITPYVMPRMHERYFMPADVLAVVFAFYFPKDFYIPVATSMVSFFAYQPYLFQQRSFPLPVLAVVLLIAIAILTRRALAYLYPEHFRSSTESLDSPTIEAEESKA